MDIVVKLNSQTAGRDKIARFLQYASRAAWYAIQQKGINGADRLKALEYTFSTFRKLLRLGRFIDVLYSALPILHHPDVTVRISLTLSKISNSLFLLADHMIWLSRTGVFQVDSEKWTKISNKYWLYSIIMNLVRDFHEITCILRAQKGRIYPSHGLRTLNDILMIGAKAFVCVQQHKDVFVDTIKNGCDVFIPLTNLGYTRLSPGTIGLLGAVSSLAGLIALIEPLAKLSPA